MRLFGKVDSAVSRFDRAEWLTPPFDRLERAAAPLYTCISGQAATLTSDRGAALSSGGSVRGKVAG